ncbi:MAG: hypothetical protein HRT36_06475 [Alphaproteobacteria bacterium]|nr:hypothetical protein [Alphaproteobacteria bacterium]
MNNESFSRVAYLSSLWFPVVLIFREILMGRAYEIDLCERVVAAIESGMNYRRAVARFSIGCEKLASPLASRWFGSSL